jgi:pilus assembly protein Flp/PilA
MKNLFVRFANDESGATAIEYGLIAAGISVVIITAVNAIGSTLTSKFEFINTELGGAAPAAP